MSDENYVRFLARKFYAPGYDRDDLAQEARLAMWLAPRGIERLVARRAVIEIVRRARRGGRPEFSELHDEHEGGDLLDLLEARETLRGVLSARLSAVEREALGYVIRGEPYARSKRLDNAVMRARRKLRMAA